MSEENRNLQAALTYATKYGWAVFPVRHATKKPLTPHGCLDAKKTPGAIMAWWGRYPDASIGIATGSISNLIVIDEDIDDEKGIDGRLEVSRWEAENGKLPETVAATTGRGGTHLYLRYRGKDIKNRAGILDGVDVRGEGGYVIAPPSTHPNGSEYEWDFSPEEFELAEVDAQVMKFLGIGQEASDEPKGKLLVPTTIKSGERNSTLFHLACSLQAQGYPDAAIMATIRATNQTACDDPLTDDELDLLVSSALKYHKGELKIISKDIPAWHEPQLTYKLDKDGNITDQPAQTIANAEEAISYDKDLYGRIRYNEIAYCPYVYGSLPWKIGKGWREWDNTDDSNLRSYIEKKYGLKSSEKIMDGLTNAAARLPVNPVRQMLESCYENWDGNAHIENLLPSMLGCEKSEYTTAVMRIFMLGAVCRAFQPGCKFDYMLVLVGEQGKGKSSFLRYLALNDAWYNDNFSTLDGTRAVENLRGMWIVEMAELQATKRAKDVEGIKSFITSRADVYREPYGRRTTQRPRMCVLAGTSNPVDFLTDKTGNRRFLPVTCGVHEPTFDIFEDEAMTRFEMAQAWGEAMDVFYQAQQKPKLTLPKKLQQVALDAQAHYTEEDPRIGIIQAWLNNTDAEAYPRVCAQMLWEEALQSTRDATRRDINDIHTIMKNNIEGWRFAGKQDTGKKYGVQRAYVRTEEFVESSGVEIPFDD